jgi:hypothetical protein
MAPETAQPWRRSPRKLERAKCHVLTERVYPDPIALSTGETRRSPARSYSVRDASVSGNP